MIVDNKTQYSIDVTETVPTVVELDDAFAALGEPNPQLDHANLNGLDTPDQHSIGAIRGLQDALDRIDALKIVYSNEKGTADYYEWADGNPEAENRLGYFVSVNSDARTITKSTGTDIFGVIVDSAALIGGQGESSRGAQYGLVAHTGIVNVRCESDVAVGDYVISSKYGMAKKSNSDYGCKVLALHDINGVTHAIVSLHLSLEQINAIGKEVGSLSSRMDDAVIDIATAINTANNAYQLASAANGDVGTLNIEVVQKVDEALNKANTAVEAVEQVQVKVTQAEETAVAAQKLAENVRTEAVTAANEALTAAHQAKSEVEALSTELAPLSESEGGIVGFVAQVDDNSSQLATVANHTYGNATGLAAIAQQVTDHESTIQTIVNWDGPDGESIASIQQKADANEASIQLLVAHMDKYSVGERSPAYGFTVEQAQEVLQDGIIYVPTVGHSETYQYADGEKTFEFNREYFYTWGNTADAGLIWLESQASMVIFSAIAPVGIDYNFWYSENTEDENYEPNTLYKRESYGDYLRWVAIATLRGGSNSRAISQIRQTSNTIASEITDARGSANSINQRLTEDENSIALVVANSDGEKTINTASIVAAINDGDSSVAINANKIVLDGATTFLNSWASANDATYIDGGKIYANSITADQIDATNLQVEAANVTGTLTADKIDVDNLKVQAVNIEGKLTADQIDATNLDVVNGTFEGVVTATSGRIGSSSRGWIIDASSIYHGSVTGTADTDLFFCTGSNNTQTIAGHTGNGWVLKAGKHCGINKSGELYCSNAHIKGTVYADNIGLEGYDTLPIDFNASFDGGVETDHDELAHGIYSLKTHATATTDMLNAAYYTPDSTATNKEVNAQIDVGVITTMGRTSCTFPSPYIKLSAQGVYDQMVTSTTTKYQECATSLRLDPEQGTLVGAWQSEGDITLAASEQTTSDRNKKNSIEAIPDAYNTLFDNLTPVIYKYNDGASDRYHTGFIAQDVKTAIDVAGLTNQDFAALCVADEGTANEVWRLRYSEFVALNTWKIQQLEKRIEEQDQRIARLENKILELTKE